MIEEQESEVPIPTRYAFGYTRAMGKVVPRGFRTAPVSLDLVMPEY